MLSRRACLSLLGAVPFSLASSQCLAGRIKPLDWIDAPYSLLKEYGAQFSAAGSPLNYDRGRLARDRGYVDAWWTCEVSGDRELRDRKFGLYLLRKEACSRDDLIQPGQTKPDPFDGEGFGIAHDFALRDPDGTFSTGYWNGDHRVSEQGLHMGVIRIKKDAGEPIRIGYGELEPFADIHDENDGTAIHRALHRWARDPARNGKYMTAKIIYVGRRRGRIVTDVYGIGFFNG